MVSPMSPNADAVLSERTEPVVAFLFLSFFEMGSKYMVLGRGGARGPTSTCSTSSILRSQLVVGAIAVGRVRVAVIKYDIAPRSN